MPLGAILFRVRASYLASRVGKGAKRRAHASLLARQTVRASPRLTRARRPALEDDAVNLEPELRGGAVVVPLAGEGAVQGFGSRVGAVCDEDRRGVEGPPAFGAFVISLVALAHERSHLQVSSR
jgi:hypothetical protein